MENEAKIKDYIKILAEDINAIINDALKTNNVVDDAQIAQIYVLLSNYLTANSMVYGKSSTLENAKQEIEKQAEDALNYINLFNI